MNKKIPFIFLFLALLASVGFGQAAKFDIPPNYISVVLISDPNCPLKLVSPTRVVGSPNGAIRLRYSLQNTSDVNIDSYVVETLNWFDTTRVTHHRTVRSDRQFSPFMTFSEFSDMEELRELNWEMAKKFGFSNIHNRIWIAMVVEVKLSDGRSYNVKPKLDSLTSFLNSLELESSTPEAEAQIAEQKLRDFVADLAESKMTFARTKP